MQRFVSIQILRGIAAMMVVMFHVVGPSALIGAGGVDIFFVISGVVMSLIVMLPEARPFSFTFDRLARIFPLYWVATLSLLAGAWFFPHVFETAPLTPDWVFKSLLLFPAFEPGGYYLRPILGQGWTLSYEMFFYSLLVLSLLLPVRWRAGFVSAVLLMLVGIGAGRLPANAVESVVTKPLLLEFLAGFWLARGIGTPMQYNRRAGLGLLMIGGAGLALGASIEVNPAESWWRLGFWGLPAFALVARFIMLEARFAAILAQSLTGRLVHLGVELGNASYAIYLSHSFVVAVLEKLWPMSVDGAGAGLFSEVLHFGLGMSLCAAFGVLIHKSLERPIAKVLRGFHPAAKPPAVLTQTASV